MTDSQVSIKLPKKKKIPLKTVGLRLLLNTILKITSLALWKQNIKKWGGNQDFCTRPFMWPKCKDVEAKYTKTFHFHILPFWFVLLTIIWLMMLFLLFDLFIVFPTPTVPSLLLGKIWVLIGLTCWTLFPAHDVSRVHTKDQQLWKGLLPSVESESISSHAYAPSK